MSSNIRIMYLYIVSFISLMMIVMGTISMVTSIASIANPVVSDYYSYKTETDFKYEDDYKKSVKQEERNGIRTAIFSGAIVGIGVPLYLYHWKKTQNIDKEEV